MTIPIKQVILESVDCGGKSTLYTSLHKATKFKYNIHDRSALSMVCYARLYGRDPTEHIRHLNEEISNANNFFVVLMLPLDVIKRRLVERGDDYQDERSIENLYEIFRSEVSRFAHLPNVLVIYQEMANEDLTSLVIDTMTEYSHLSPEDFGAMLRAWPECTDNLESQVTVCVDIPVEYNDLQIMLNSREGDYYKSIITKCEDIVRCERNAINPYFTPQGDYTSRRFYFSSDTCVSSIHFLPRTDEVRVLCTLRSTDAVRNGALDMRFLSHLATHMTRKFGWRTDHVLLTVNFNSLHIRTDLK